MGGPPTNPTLAERDGKNVSVENGILSVCGVPVFSIQDGKIANN